MLEETMHLEKQKSSDLKYMSAIAQRFLKFCLHFTCKVQNNTYKFHRHLTSEMAELKTLLSSVDSSVGIILYQ